MNQSASTILDILKKSYPDAHIALHFSTPWEFLVATELSAQCTDTRVNIVTEKLFKKYPTLEDYCKANIREFESDIKSTGFYHNKAKHILAAARLIKEKFNGKVPKTMDTMLTIPGVGRKTANVVLGNTEGIAVDTHVARVSQRLGIVSGPKNIEQELMALVPKQDWKRITFLFIDHGRAICLARNPKCAECVVQPYCPSSRAFDKK